MNGPKPHTKTMLMFLLFLAFHFLQRSAIDAVRGILIDEGAQGLIVPCALILRFGILLPVLLKITGMAFGDLGLNAKNLKTGFYASVHYFLWILLLGYAVSLAQAYPFQASGEPRHWSALRFVDVGFHQFVDILLFTALWEETMTRGFVLAYLERAGLDQPWGRFKLNKALLFSSLFFGLMHVQNFWGARSPEQIAFALVYIAGSVLVGYMLALVRKKAGSLFWPILMHTLANFGEWAIAFLIPMVMGNR